MKATSFLDDLCGRLQASFQANKRVMSFGEYVELYLAKPQLQARGAAQYMLDCIEHFGQSNVSTPFGERQRFSLYDMDFADGDGKLIGQEGVQIAVHNIIRSFARQRHVNKLILLHGPNGSAKSSILGCIGRGLEHYSRSDEGAQYTFGWVFPSRKAGKQPLGFGGGAGAPELGTYAYLDDVDVDARIPSDLRDHPLLLLPMEDRRRLLDKAEEDSDGTFLAPDWLLRGELSPRNQQIAELLFHNYQGDMREVLRHVQVQRFFISRRFRRGSVTVEPQLHVDAAVRQLTGDRSLSTLPLVLQSTTLYEAHGDLVDAHRGMIEYNDLLKRPLDSFKYLLATCEKSSVALPSQILSLDLLFMASSNETHLRAFKEYPDWPSFKGRFELIRVPYILSYVVEKQIYDDQVRQENIEKRIAPHATYVAALWAVLTRLRKPSPEKYDKSMRGTVGSLTPLQKADLYARGRAPAGLALEKARRLKALAEAMPTEALKGDDYEGKSGASPREMKVLLHSAAQQTDFRTLSPLAVLAEIRELCKQTSIYSFLSHEPDGQFGDNVAFIEVVRQNWMDLADDELTHAMGLVTREQYDDLFKRYLIHVSHAGRGEKLMNPVTHDLDDPDFAFLEEMEKRFGVDKGAREFRSTVLGRIGAASQPGVSAEADYRSLFVDLFKTLEDSYYDEQRQTVRMIAGALLQLLSDDTASLSRVAQSRAQATLDSLIDEFGYCQDSAREMVSTLVAERYQD